MLLSLSALASAAGLAGHGVTLLGSLLHGRPIPIVGFRAPASRQGHHPALNCHLSLLRLFRHPLDRRT